MSDTKKLEIEVHEAMYDFLKVLTELVNESTGSDLTVEEHAQIILEESLRLCAETMRNSVTIPTSDNGVLN